MHPYNQVISLPVTDSLTKRVVKKYAKQQNCPPLPNLPAGTFECVVRLEDHSVFMFKFKKPQPCSGVRKGLLPALINKHIDLPTPAEDLRGLASSYLYLRDHKYDIQSLQNEKTVSVTLQPGEPLLADKRETTRTGNLLEALKSRVKNDRYASIKVALAETDSSHFCPFSGGGDIYLQTDHISACLRLSDEDDGEAEALGAEEGTQVSPRKKGEIRCTGAVETKFSVQSVDKVLRQLQADMLVGATQQLKTIVTNEPTKAKDIKSFSTYGITFGVSIAHPLIVLKMTLDFETNVLDYLQLCRYEWSETFNVYVDGAFEYVMERVALPTPSPPPPNPPPQHQ